MIPTLSLGRSENSRLQQSFVARALANAPLNTLLGEAPRPVNPDKADLYRQNECILLACDVGIIWPFAHMGIAFAQRLTLLEDGVRRVRRQFLVSYRSVRSWLWSEQPKRSMGCARSFPEIRRGRWAHPWTRLDGVRGNPHLDTRVCLRAVARVISIVRESAKGLSNNNNSEYLLNFFNNHVNWIIANIVLKMTLKIYF